MAHLSPSPVSHVMAYLQLYVGVCLLAASRAQESGVATLLGNTTTTSNTNGTATANAEKDIKPLDIKETLLATPEVKSPQEGNVSVEVKSTSNLTEISSPVEKEDPQIAAKQIKGGEGLKTLLVAEPDAVKKGIFNTISRVI